jgi:hypothetical protein
MRRLAAATVAALTLAGLTVAGTLPSYADDVDLSDSGDNSLTVPDGGSASFSVRLLEETGNNLGDVPGCNATAANPVTISFTAGDSWLSTDPTSIQVTDCTTVHTVTALVAAGTATATQGANSKITGTAGGGRSATVEVRHGQDTETVTIDPTYKPDFITVHVPATGSTTSTNAAPEISLAASDANGVEGDTLTAGGAFTDDGGVGNLTITATGDQADRVVDNGDGTWSWDYPTTDNGSGTVTVTATDAGGLTATDDFTWSATNANPVLGTVAGTRAGACAVNLSASFTDAGIADTHTATVAWGDASASEAATVTETVGTGAGTVTGQHAYTAAGAYTATVTVTDDDGGSGTASTGFTAYNTPSSILAPINTGGTRSSFKIGSTIPVKITVTGCDGGLVSTLTPQVNLVQGDSTPEFPVNEEVYSGSATNGKLMRWDATGQQYIYNLSTKLSQFTGAALSAGTYTVAVNDASFAVPVRATFDIRK